MNLSGLANIIGNSIVGGVPGGGGGTPPQPANAWSMQTDGVNQYAESVTTPYDTLDGATNFSFSVWVKPDNLTHHRIITHVARDLTANNSQFFLWIRANTGELNFSMEVPGFYIRSNVGLTAGVWQHVAVTVDFSQPQCQTGRKSNLYINGVNVNGLCNQTNAQWAGTSLSPSTGQLGIGEDIVTGTLAPFYGFMDEFAIWNGVTLSPADVLGIYNQAGAGKPGNLNQLTNPPNLWYRFGDNNTPPGSGTAIPNQGSSGATDNGVAINGASFVNDTP